jgi:hypothetical protein
MFVPEIRINVAIWRKNHENFPSADRPADRQNGDDLHLNRRAELHSHPK